MFSKEIQHSMISNFFHSTIFTNVKSMIDHPEAKCATDATTDAMMEVKFG